MLQPALYSAHHEQRIASPTPYCHLIGNGGMHARTAPAYLVLCEQRRHASQPDYDGHTGSSASTSLADSQQKKHVPTVRSPHKCQTKTSAKAMSWKIPRRASGVLLAAQLSKGTAIVQSASITSTRKTTLECTWEMFTAASTPTTMDRHLRTRTQGRSACWTL